ncbi:MAG: NAD(P)H-dependent oxidoreductase [Methylococcales bacterium]|nr:NAD(P)H-dependent oxidoreductase [Methylococcales bacterium]
MSKQPSILAFSGSTRRGSFNDLLVRVAAREAQTYDVSVTMIRLCDFSLPLYNADLEAEHGIPDAGLELKKLMQSHQGFLIASPEYNSSLSAVLKNSIDWASRREEGEARLSCFDAKVVGLLSAAPGKLGGLRGLTHLRSILSSMGCLVIPEQMALATAHLAFDDQGQLKDEAMQHGVAAVAAGVAELLKKLY